MHADKARRLGVGGALLFSSLTAFPGSAVAGGRQEPPPAPAPAGGRKSAADDKRDRATRAVKPKAEAARPAARPFAFAAAATPNPSGAVQAVVAQQRADRLLGAGDIRAAAQSYASAALASPQDAVLRMAVGVTLAEAGMKDQAVAQFQRAADLAEDDLIAALLLQNGLSEAGDGARAQELQHDIYRRYARAGGKGGLNADTSVRRLSDALRRTPKSPVLHLLLGDAYQLAEQWDRADPEYRAAMEAAPLWVKPRVNLGLSQLAQGKADEAIRTFEDALRLNPKNPQALVGKGDAERESGRNQDAIATYQRVVNGRGVSRAAAVQAMTGIGQAFANVGRLDRAFVSLDNAQKLAPKDPQPSTVIGEIQLQNGNFSAAEDAYATALRITRGGGLFAQRPALYRSLAEAQLSARHPDRARQTLMQALRDEPGASALWHRLLAQAAFDQGNAAEGEAELRAALERETGPYPLDTLRAIDARGLLPAMRSHFERRRDEARTGITAAPLAGGGVAITNRAGRSGSPAPATAAAGEAAAVAVLAGIAQYQNDTARETELRESLSRLRNVGWDWFAFAEMYDQRSLSPARAAECYRKALNAGGLNEAATRWARQRLQALTEPAFKP